MCYVCSYLAPTCNFQQSPTESRMSVLNTADKGEAFETLRNVIHQEFGKPAGLLRDEYTVIVDTEIKDDVRTAGGPCVIIITRFWPDDFRFMDILKHVFKDYPLKQMLHSKALIRLSDAEKWYSISEAGFFKPVDKKATYDTCTIRYITSLEVTDKKTKRSVRVEIEGNAFDARAKAMKLLYPESENEEHKAAIRRANKIKKGGRE